MRTLSRRGFFRGAAAASAAAFTATALPGGALAQPTSVAKVVDLTHTLTPDFPTFSGDPAIDIKRVVSFEKDGYNINQLTYTEHVGTHMDAPIHFSKDGKTADALAANTLVVPVAVIDVRSKAEQNPDYQVTPDDLKAWEAANGRLPEGGAVAMNSGWARHLGTPKFRNLDDKGVMHFPGFGKEATAFMMERNLQGMVVDTLSLDHGASKDFATHLTWLPSGRWGIENAANLDQVPANGATIVVGGPKILGATGGPSRVFALLP